MLHRLFNSQTKSITFAALLLGVSALASRLFGLLRIGLIAGHFGRGEQADIYFAAFRIPDFVYNILIAGGVIIAFLPLFSEYYSKNKEKAWQFTNYTLNTFLFLLVLLSLIFFIFTPQLLKFITPGFSARAQSTAIALTRLMFLSPILFGVGSIFSGILHYFNRFLVYSLAPILYNLGIIFGILVLTPFYGIFGVGIGVVLGALCHLLIQIPAAISCGFRYKFLFSFREPAIRKIFRLMVPRMFAVAAQQINLMVITAIASFITTGAIAIFTYANDLQYFPLGIIAIPFALASFPALSRAWAQGKKEKFFQTFSTTFHQILFLIVPASVLMFILRAQLVRLILGSFGDSKFDWLATRLTAACLGIFALGIFASALIPLLARAFFAFQNTKTPALIALFSVGLNIILSFSFVYLLSDTLWGWFPKQLANVLKLKGIENIAVLGLPLAFSLAMIFQFSLLLFFFVRKNRDVHLFLGTCPSLKKILIASFLMALTTYLSLYFINSFVDTHTILGLLCQTLLAGLVGISVYILTAFLLKSPELEVILKQRRQKQRHHTQNHQRD